MINQNTEQSQILFCVISIERKSRMRQIRGVKGEAAVSLLQALDNKGDSVSSAFPKGKQNEDRKEKM